MGLKRFFRKVRRLGFDGIFQRLDEVYQRLEQIENNPHPTSSTSTLMLQVGDLQSRAVKALPDRVPIAEAEFKVFSQFGDDGIIQYLFSRIPAIDTFVEFGVEDYSEANTRFLLEHDNWRGLILDGRPDLEECLLRRHLPYLHDLTAISAFITAENIDNLLQCAGFAGEIGLLSIDIDGNDYWVWKAITVIRPQVVVVEYNAIFGPQLAVTTPYRSDFQRGSAHHSWLYFGASLTALRCLADEKGYTFVGCTSAGNNAYFVREDLAAPFHKPPPCEGYVNSRFRESRAKDGSMDRLGDPDRMNAIEHLPVVNINTGETLPLRDLWGKV